MGKNKNFNYQDIIDSMTIIGNSISGLKDMGYDLSFLLEYVDDKDIEKYLREKKIKNINGL